MIQRDLITKLRSLVYVIRHGQIEKVLAVLTLALLSAASYLRQEWKGHLEVSHYLYALCASCALWLTIRLWKQAVPPPVPSDEPVSDAVKGLFPFTMEDGKLFARMGRGIESHSLVGLARNEQVALTVLRGESGAGKTSLLQASIQYTLGDKCIYWEAIPANAPHALLHALRSKFPELNSLESLPEACSSRLLLILDQFEQLYATDPEHAEIFALLERIAKGPAPHKLSVIVALRREFAANWLDFEQAHGFRAEQIAINLLAPRTAGDVLTTLASEAGFSLDNALVENFIASVAQPSGISPVDIAIGILSLANRVQQSGTTHVGLAEYTHAGGAEGLLRSFVQEKLEETPESIRASLLKGIILALVDLASNQRVSEGATEAIIAAKADAPVGSLTPWLERLAHPRIRLLEKSGSDRYRLPHERLVPVLRRLTGTALAALDQLRLAFESSCERWRETQDRRYLLRGKELKKVLRNRNEFVQGKGSAFKARYLVMCLRWRHFLRLVAGLTAMAAVSVGYVALQSWNKSIQEQKLRSWDLPADLYRTQGSLDYLFIAHHSVNDPTWLRSPRLNELDLHFHGLSLKGLDHMNGLTSLSLNLAAPNVASIEELSQLQGLKSLSLDLARSRVKDLTDLKPLKKLTTLTLKLGHSKTSLEGLNQLQELRSLSLDLTGSEMTNLAGLAQLKELTTLSLDLRYSKIRNLTGLEQLQGLKSLSLDLNHCEISDLTGLEQLEGLTALSLDLSYSGITDLPTDVTRLRHLNHLTTLALRLGGYQDSRLPDLEQLQQVTTLSLDLTDSDIDTLTGLSQLKNLTTLVLNVGASNLTTIERLTQLNVFTKGRLDASRAYIAALARQQYLDNISHIDIRGNPPDPPDTQLRSLAGLEGLQGLKSLQLGLVGSDIEYMSTLQQLKGLTTLSLDLRGLAMTKVPRLEQLHGLKSLQLRLAGSDIEDISALQQLKGVTTLSLDLRGLKIRSLAGLELLPALTDLDLDLTESKIASLEGLKQCKSLTALSLRLASRRPSPFQRPGPGSQITSLSGLEQLQGLTELRLALGSDSQITSLNELEHLTALDSLDVVVPTKLLPLFGGLKIRRDIVRIWILMNRDDSLSISGRFHFVGLIDNEEAAIP